ncbi:PHF5-like protein [Kipferlia bialata]|uniref:PHF5-like protein n=1 Tax=Kipferlia bialata TaxID=797122 RepID=A0A9K3CYR4_9EUKA|nr:PHF5-like protein [Kipferlia bialata]|eukprot:g6401.t1
MARHHPDLVFCRKISGASVGLLCERCEGRCCICDSFVRPCIPVHVCDDCAYGSNSGRCIICGAKGVTEAYYCEECCLLEKDRDGCPRVINIGVARSDLFYERRKHNLAGGGGKGKGKGKGK